MAEDLVALLEALHVVLDIDLAVDLLIEGQIWIGDREAGIDAEPDDVLLRPFVEGGGGEKL